MLQAFIEQRRAGLELFISKLMGVPRISTNMYGMSSKHFVSRSILLVHRCKMAVHKFFENTHGPNTTNFKLSGKAGSYCSHPSICVTRSRQKISALKFYDALQL